MNIIDYSGRIIRLNDERLAHIKEHPENEILVNPDIVVKSKTNDEARLYYTGD